MAWETKADLRARIEELERYNRFLQEEVRRRHDRWMTLRKATDDAFARIDKGEEELSLAVHDMRRDEDSSFALGWNQAVGHVEKLITDLLGVDLKAASEVML